jgi:hypothetical protein
MSRRDGAIVAWHEVPGTAPPQECAHFDPKIPLGLATPDHTVPYGTDLSRDAFPGTFVPGYDQMSRALWFFI